jgi:hypothetical protein
MPILRHLTFSARAHQLSWASPYLYDRDCVTMCGAYETMDTRDRCQACEVLVAFAIANKWAAEIVRMSEQGDKFDLFAPMTPKRVREAMKEVAA